MGEGPIRKCDVPHVTESKMLDLRNLRPHVKLLQGSNQKWRWHWSNHDNPCQNQTNEDDDDDEDAIETAIAAGLIP